MNIELNKYGPDKDKYFSSRFIAWCSNFYGDRGQVAYGFYSYLRWVDNRADTTLTSKNERLDFFTRQEQLINGNMPENPTEMEEMLLNLPWESVNDQKEQIMNNLQTVVDTIKDDVEHSGLIPRTKEEIDEYYLKTFLSIIEAFNLSFSSKSVMPTSKFETFLKDWMIIGTLKDLSEDLENKMLQLGFTPSQVIRINEQIKFKLEKWLLVRVIQPPSSSPIIF